MRWSSAVLALMLVSVPIISQERAPRRYEQQSMMWLEIKKALTGPDAKKYFEAMKGATLPIGMGTGPNWDALHAFEGILVSSAPTDRPNEFLVAMPGSKTPEVTLRTKDRLAKPLPAGTPVSFEGEVIAFTREPFMLTLEAITVNRVVRPDELRISK